MNSLYLFICLMLLSCAVIAHPLVVHAGNPTEKVNQITDEADRVEGHSNAIKDGTEHLDNTKDSILSDIDTTIDKTKSLFSVFGQLGELAEKITGKDEKLAQSEEENATKKDNVKVASDDKN